MGAGNNYVGPPTGAREAEADQAPDGQTISTSSGPKWRETEMSGKCWETS